ncbi:hypothetical protein GEMRC1_007589 [Eukaryota sp. GEM-RC1]
MCSNIPYNFVDAKLTRENSVHPKTSSSSLKAYGALLVAELETKIGSLLEQFGLIFDTWQEDCSELHYLGVYAVRPVSPKLILLGTFPFHLDDETAADDGTADIDTTVAYFGVDGTISLLEEILARYGKCTRDASFLVSDNCPTNYAIARALNLPLIGCAAHRFQFGSETYSDFS